LIAADSSETRICFDFVSIRFSPGGQTLVALAQREVPHDLGNLEDVAGAQLLVVGLEASGPVGRHGPVTALEDLEDLVDLLLVDDVAQPDLVGRVRGDHQVRSP
jgi:hypothetical protein